MGKGLASHCVPPFHLRLPGGRLSDSGNYSTQDKFISQELNGQKSHLLKPIMKTIAPSLTSTLSNHDPIGSEDPLRNRARACGRADRRDRVGLGRGGGGIIFTLHLFCTLLVTDVLQRTRSVCQSLAPQRDTAHYSWSQDRYALKPRVNGEFEPQRVTCYTLALLLTRQILLSQVIHI